MINLNQKTQGPKKLSGKTLGKNIPAIYCSKGFNVVELLIVVSIVGILAAIAIPNFTNVLGLIRVRTAIDTISSTLYLAKSEAIKFGGGITIQPVGTTWSSGMTVRNAGGTTLRNTNAFRDVDIAHLSGATSITVDRWGKFAGGGQLAGNFSATSTATGTSKSVCVSLGGRISQKSGSSCP